ncbi:MAG: hypothetical protein J7L99_01140 [Planctomycetes bacterium]|nr:hypothetical protein [Planctomycetota bacterium]
MRKDNRAVRLEDGILLQGFICIRTIHFASRLLGMRLVSTLDNYRLAIYNLDKVKGMVNLFHRIGA